MTEKSTDGENGVPLDDLPLQNTRRTLLRVLGGTAAIGGAAGFAAGQDDDEEEPGDPATDPEDELGEADDEEPDDDEDDDGDGGTGEGLSLTLFDVLTVNGLSVTDEAIQIQELRLDALEGGGTFAVATATGVQVPVEDGAITGISVDAVELPDVVESEVESAIGALASSTTPDAVTALPASLAQQVTSTDTSVFQGIDEQLGGSRTLSDLIESSLSDLDDGVSETDPLLLVFLLIVGVLLSLDGSVGNGGKNGGQNGGKNGGQNGDETDGEDEDVTDGDVGGGADGGDEEEEDEF